MLNPFWKQSPFVRFILPFILGISLFNYFPIVRVMPVLYAIALVLVLYAIPFFLADYKKYTFRYLHGIGLFLVIGCSGYAICVLHSPFVSSKFYCSHVKEYAYALVRINAELEEKEKTYKAAVDVKQLLQQKESIPTNGEAIIYFQKTDKLLNLHTGDYILLKNKFTDLKSSGNPGAFDYAKYCHRNNVYQSAFVRESEWRKTTWHTEDLASYFEKLNKKTRVILQSYIRDTVAASIAEALLIGYRKDIDKDIWQSYSNTGIVHIIAISGMHMSMIYMSIRYLLLLLPFFKKRKNMALWFAIILMWCFAILTGVPPSVNRAAVMFTFLGVGEMINKKMPVYNNLAASAFVLLCCNPSWLWDVGFQLSYLAVLSLVIFYKPFVDKMVITNKILNAIWEMIAITIAAQILTFPFCIYYFHQFPLLFILTNLVAVPATTIILYAEIILVAFHWIPPLAHWIGFAISISIQGLNQFVFFIGHIPYAVWTGIGITEWQLLVLVIFIVCISVWLFYKRIIYFVYAVCCILFFMFSVDYAFMKSFQTHRMIVYQMPKQKSIEFNYGNEFYSPDEKEILSNPKNSNYVSAPSRREYHVTKMDSSIVELAKKHAIELYFFGGKKMARIHSEAFNCKTPMPIDILIVSETNAIHASWIKRNFDPNQIILDSSIPFWKTESIKTELAALHIPIYDVQASGAWVMNW